MNWEAIGATAELAGAIGVILSLVYLASQIRLNARHVEASVYQSTNDVFVNWLAELARDPATADLWYRQISRGEVDEARESQARALLGVFFLALENNFHQHRHGVVWRDALTLRGLPRLFASPVVDRWIEHDGASVVTPEFLEAVRAMRARGRELVALA